MITALLLFSVYRISVSQSQTVEVEPGEETTLLCVNTSTSSSPTFWFRLVNTTKASCISVMFPAEKTVAYCEGFQSESFNISSNTSTIFLTIKHVDVSDSGLYFCGCYVSGRPVFTVINLKVRVRGNDESGEVNKREAKKESNGILKLMCGILGVLSLFFLMVIITLIAKNKKLQKGDNQEQNPQCTEILDSAALKDEAHSLYSAAVRSRRPASDRNVLTHVIYAANR